MPFIPHTEEDIRAMLDSIGAESVEDLFDEIPADLRAPPLTGIPEGESEMGITRLMQERAAKDGMPSNFIGAGAYEHHIPAAVWQIATRGEFYSAYTPYQAEASQGTLQLIYEYQTMISRLTGMEVSNASLYDGASALAEAVLMAVRVNRRSKAKRVLLPGALHPDYRKVVKTLIGNQGIELVELPFDETTGQTPVEALAPYADDDVTAMVISQPNFFGILEDVDALTGWAEERGIPVIAVVNPVSLALLKPPGEWGANGVDIVVGEGQPLGAPLSSGGPYYGFMTTLKKHIRQMPGRIVGRAEDADGKPGFVLTLQAREQHIRRSKATSNICTNQGLVVTASTIHMSLLGDEGLTRVAEACYANTHALVEKLAAKGIKPRFTGEYFHEVALDFGGDAATRVQTMADAGVLAGLELSRDYPQLDGCVLACATETKTESDLEQYVTTWEQAA
ncbi:MULTISPECIES: aminomethyl-transferring glycine dehydrogenase subunit GcvPA [Thioalkalivibrio]|uniref:Probable glycine dehydrogenase (decarboxylating) subunit 1 n=1 Tax=Thioalkalivibrio versutus TaxID=106634 RepID=A0A0G3G059_9GAMM|nr:MULTISPECIES: aminomethyl-transferring glycine dehydrogenase subunit GcvPA [Thioalkalivibrio]AKJ94603.1 glycine dehydrogenase [Thioalkalivibrio versutus]OOC49210.1 glycine dehydrogenase [Thioalkalivibrio versutus]